MKTDVLVYPSFSVQNADLGGLKVVGGEVEAALQEGGDGGDGRAALHGTERECHTV